MFSHALALSSLNASFNNIGAIIVVIITTINIGAKITFDIIPNFTPLFATIRATSPLKPYLLRFEVIPYLKT